MSTSKSTFPEALTEDLYHCLKCGMCQPFCPTFRATRQEYFTPRGRVQLIKHYLEGDVKVTPVLEHILSSCILCDACAAMCPSGVQIDRLLRNMRIELARTMGMGIKKRLLFASLQGNPRRRACALMGRVGQTVLVDALKAPWKLGNVPLARLPRLHRRSFRRQIGERVPARGKRIGRIVYFTGCATDSLYHDVGTAVVEVLTFMGFEVIVPRTQVCCAAPMFLAGSIAEALPNIYANLTVLDQADADAVVVDCATCGAAFKKEIPRLLEDLGRDTEQARRVAGKIRDASQIVAESLDKLEFAEPRAGEALAVTYHDPCHLARGMKVTAEPRRILAALPDVTFTEMEGAADCCGGGGTYQFEHVALSADITARKAESIRGSGATVVATGCPGCRMTLTAHLPEQIEVLHTIQFLAQRLRKRGPIA